MASICCSPPDRVPASCLLRSRSLGNMSSAASTSSLRAPPGTAKAPTSMFSSTVIDAKICRPSGTWIRPRPTSACGVRAAVGDAAVADGALDLGQHPADRLEQRGLAGAVGADDAHGLAGSDLERDIAHRAQVAVVGRHLSAATGRAQPAFFFSQVGLHHVRIGAHRVGRAAGDHGAGIHHVDVARNLHHELDVVLDQHHADAPRRQLAQRVAQRRLSSSLSPAAGSSSSR